MVRGDVDAVAELYDLHSRLVFGLILRMLQDRSEAEEVVQEVFLAAWNKAATYDAALGSVVGWLLRIARNRAIDRLRARSSRDRQRTATEDAPPAGSVAESPESGMLQFEQRWAVTQALDALPAEQRALIEHAYFEGLSHAQLAVQFKLPLGTVKTRIRAGMMALRQQLQDDRVWS
jgi:RNA polymerase sigma-70 factor (ECF subfamily)